MNHIIETLLDYAIKKQLMASTDRCYARNRILALLKSEGFEPCYQRMHFTHVDELLQLLCDIAIKQGVIEDTIHERDNFDSALMDCVMMRPSQVIEQFYQEEARRAATKQFYEFSKDSNYIRTKRIAQNISYQVESEFGTIDITINCSKPEKDPKDIERAKLAVQSAYPTCVLCKENEGFYGNSNRDGRSSIRLIPITLQREQWYLQYSPYVYYNEHCIVLSGQHVPMKTCRETFLRLLEFVDFLPHYFLGANADLPLVGGSILSHDHYQGGNYTFAMANASSLEDFDYFQDKGVKAQRLHWPLSVLRLSSKHISALVEVADQVLQTWRTYSDETCGILAHSDQDHNTISTIARKRNDYFELDLVLRNNRTSVEHPLGIFHPHEEIHHIKKENIGIIEVMGLAVLPARLKDELKWIKKMVLDGDTSHTEDLKAHLAWTTTLSNDVSINKENIDSVLANEVGTKFIEGLKHCGVYKLDTQGTQGFQRFLEAVQQYKGGICL